MSSNYSTGCLTERHASTRMQMSNAHEMRVRVLRVYGRRAQAHVQLNGVIETYREAQD